MQGTSMIGGAGGSTGMGGGIFIILMFTTVGSFMATGTFGLGILLSGVFGNEANNPTMFWTSLSVFLISLFLLKKRVWHYEMPKDISEQKQGSNYNRPIWL